MAILFNIINLSNLKFYFILGLLIKYNLNDNCVSWSKIYFYAFMILNSFEI